MTKANECTREKARENIEIIDIDLESFTLNIYGTTEW